MSQGGDDGQAAPEAEIEARLWDRPGFLIRRLHQIHVALFLEECRGFDVTPVQYAVLTALAIAPGPGPDHARPRRRDRPHQRRRRA